MNRLPEIHVLYPQREPVCSTSVSTAERKSLEKEEYVEVAGYHYCDEVSFAKLAIEEGNAFRRWLGNRHKLFRM